MKSNATLCDNKKESDLSFSESLPKAFEKLAIQRDNKIHKAATLEERAGTRKDPLVGRSDSLTSEWTEIESMPHSCSDNDQDLSDNEREAIINSGSGIDSPSSDSEWTEIESIPNSGSDNEQTLSDNEGEAISNLISRINVSPTGFVIREAIPNSFYKSEQNLSDNDGKVINNSERLIATPSSHLSSVQNRIDSTMARTVIDTYPTRKKLGEATLNVSNLSIILLKAQEELTMASKKAEAQEEKAENRLDSATIEEAIGSAPFRNKGAMRAILNADNPQGTLKKIQDEIMKSIQSKAQEKRADPLKKTSLQVSSNEVDMIEVYKNQIQRISCELGELAQADIRKKRTVWDEYPPITEGISSVSMRIERRGKEEDKLKERKELDDSVKAKT